MKIETSYEQLWTDKAIRIPVSGDLIQPDLAIIWNDYESEAKVVH